MVGTPAKRGMGVLAGAGIGVGVLAIVGAVGYFVLGGGGGSEQAQPADPVAAQPEPRTQNPAPAAVDQGTTTAPTTGTVQVIGLPPGGQVLVDGVQQSGTSFELDQGAYTILLQADGFEEDEQRVTVIAGETNSIGFNARRVAVVQAPQTQTDPPPVTQQPPPVQAETPQMGSLQLLVTPAARVEIDGTSIGEQRQVRADLTPGGHKVVFMREGIVTLDTTFTIIAGQVTRGRIRLIPEGF